MDLALQPVNEGDSSPPGDTVFPVDLFGDIGIAGVNPAGRGRCRTG